MHLLPAILRKSLKFYQPVLLLSVLRRQMLQMENQLLQVVKFLVFLRQQAEFFQLLQAVDFVQVEEFDFSEGVYFSFSAVYLFSTRL